MKKDETQQTCVEKRFYNVLRDSDNAGQLEYVSMLRYFPAYNQKTIKQYEVKARGSAGDVPDTDKLDPRQTQDFQQKLIKKNFFMF